MILPDWPSTTPWLTPEEKVHRLIHNQTFNANS